MFKIFTQKWLTLLLSVGLLLMSSLSVVQAEEVQVAAMRDGIPLDEEVSPPAVAKVENKDLKRMRDYPQQPPTIPHNISKLNLSHWLKMFLLM